MTESDATTKPLVFCGLICPKCTQAVGTMTAVHRGLVTFHCEHCGFESKIAATGEEIRDR